MIAIENRTVFAAIVSESIEKVQHNRAFNFNEAHKKSVINAISKAVIRIREQGEFMTYEPAADRFLIWSQSSNLVYELGPDGRHGCMAELQGAVCWHKAAKRLIALYTAAMLDPFTSGYFDPGDEAMPYLQPEDERKRESCGGVWI